MKSGSEFAKLKQQLVEEKLGVVQRCRICGADIRSAWPGDNVCVLSAPKWAANSWTESGATSTLPLSRCAS